MDDIYIYFTYLLNISFVVKISKQNQHCHNVKNKTIFHPHWPITAIPYGVYT